DAAHVDGRREHARRRRGLAEIRHWAQDPNLVGIYISPQAPDGKLLDNPDLYPLYDVAQDLDLPLLAHGGTARPPYGPGSFDLDGAWFLLHSFANPWAGMAALGALIGGGVFEMFPRLRVAGECPADHRSTRALTDSPAETPRAECPAALSEAEDYRAALERVGSPPRMAVRAWPSDR